MNHKWMHAYRVSAKMLCSASGGPLCVILWGGVTDWGSHKWTDGRVWETDARPGRSELKGSGLLAADGIQGGCNSLGRDSVRPRSVYLSFPPFSSNTHLWFSEGTAGLSPSEPGAHIVLTFLSTATACWLLWVEGVYGDLVNWCTKQPIKR